MKHKGGMKGARGGAMDETQEGAMDETQGGNEAARGGNG